MRGDRKQRLLSQMRVIPFNCDQVVRVLIHRCDSFTATVLMGDPSNDVDGCRMSSNKVRPTNSYREEMNMRVLFLVLALVSCVSFTSAQAGHPQNWNSMNAEEQAKWNQAHPNGMSLAEVPVRSGVGDENVIRQLESEWEEALKKGDQATIDRIVAPDCLFVSSTGELSLKPQTDAERRAFVKLIASGTTQMNVRVFGDTAIVIGTNLETSSYRDQDTSGQYRWTDVFLRRNGRWQVVSAHSTRME